MIQRQAQVDEVRWSRLQTELASSQNLSVMIFTTFTVIFLPLSFFTSLFGMNTREWGVPENFVSLKLIGVISRESLSHSFPCSTPSHLDWNQALIPRKKKHNSPRISLPCSNNPRRSIQRARPGRLQSQLPGPPLRRRAHQAPDHALAGTGR